MRSRVSTSRRIATCRGTTASTSSSAISSAPTRKAARSRFPLDPRQVLKRVLGARGQAWRRADVLARVRVLQLRRDAALVGGEEGRRSRADHAGHVRLFAAARESREGLLQGAVHRMRRVRHPDRGAAYRDRSRRLRGRDHLQRSARGRRPRDPVQAEREGDRRALRHHAELHGEVEPAVSRAARATSTRASRTARRTCSTTRRAAAA